MTNRIVIAGALGTVGRAALEHFDGLEGWEVIALSRRPPDFENGATWLSVDLRDAADTRGQAWRVEGSHASGLCGGV